MCHPDQSDHHPVPVGRHGKHARDRHGALPGVVDIDFDRGLWRQARGVDDECGVAQLHQACGDQQGVNDRPCEVLGVCESAVSVSPTIIAHRNPQKDPDQPHALIVGVDEFQVVRRIACR